jgi:hypothetical protein
MVMIGTREMMEPRKKTIRPWKRVEVNVDEPINFGQWACEPQGGGMSDDEVVRIVNLDEERRREEMSKLYRRFTNQLIETMRQMGAP